MKQARKRKHGKDRRRKWIFPGIEMAIAMGDDPLGLYLADEIGSVHRSAFLKGFAEGFRAAEKRAKGGR